MRMGPLAGVRCRLGGGVGGGAGVAGGVGGEGQPLPMLGIGWASRITHPTKTPPRQPITGIRPIPAPYRPTLPGPDRCLPSNRRPGALRTGPTVVTLYGRQP